jgi:hypothetical protein
MDWQTFVNTWIAKVQQILIGLKNNLVLAGVKANSIIIAEVADDENVGDLRYRITGTRGNKTFIMYLELTSGSIVNGQMGIIPTLWVEGNGSQINTTYVAGPAMQYNDTAQQQAILAKLDVADTLTKGELLTAIRAFLGV